MTIGSEHDWVAPLARRYTLASRKLNDPDAPLHQQLPSLQFAASALEKARAHQQSPDHATHVVVIGPTQSGKSTLVNLLLDSNAASVSALAGFTVHSQGYASKINDSDIDYVDSLMTPLKRIPGDMLDSADLESYVLEPVSAGTSPLVKDAVVWDTPDFDSITAAVYSLAVIRAAALADIIVLTVSKDKYGDKKVWDMLDLFNAMGKPLLVCINKVSDADRELISRAFTERYIQIFGKEVPRIIMLPFVQRDETQSPLLLDENTRLLLQNAIQNVRDTVNNNDLYDHCNRFIHRYEAQWLEPLLAEVDAREQWLALTDEVINEADEYYVTHYLESPDKYETFNRALAELLTLLEIPGVAKTLTQARQAITWPARRLLGLGRDLIKKPREPALSANGQVMDNEKIVLQHILDSTLIRMQRELLDASNGGWWEALDSGLRDELPTIRKQFDQTSEQARQEFEPEIEKAAAALYEQLKKQPALLNTLRAARASADAAGIALAVKSGGLAPADLILAPAMLSVTTLLTESALGRYLDSIKKELKQRQRDNIREHVFDAALRDNFVRLVNQLNRPELLSNALEPALALRLDNRRDASSTNTL